jgi:kinesin family protein 2/24
MNLINEVDKPGSDIDTYVSHLDKILEEKENRIKTLRSKLVNFSSMLKKEEMISQHLLNHNDAFDVFDLNNDN